jgi:hypothetical protein
VKAISGLLGVAESARAIGPIAAVRIRKFLRFIQCKGNNICAVARLLWEEHKVPFDKLRAGSPLHKIIHCVDDFVSVEMTVRFSVAQLDSAPMQSFF